MAAPTKELLEAELEMALEQLHAFEYGATAQSSVDHTTVMIRVWSLRFQIANHEYDAAKKPDVKFAWRKTMQEASREIMEWEKRKSVALADIANDLIIAGARHEAEQAKLAGALEALE